MSGNDSDFRAPHLRNADFLGAFAVIEDRARGAILMVRNERHIGGATVATWDLPGGQVEPGETLHEALRRELEEEVGIEPLGSPEFLFLQEGLRRDGGRRSHVWRSFFFAVTAFRGEPCAGAEVTGCRFVPRAELFGLLDAPYHDSFRAWLGAPGTFYSSAWDEA